MTFGGAGSRSTLDQGLQHPLNYVPVVSEEEFGHSNLDFLPVRMRGMCTLTSICLQSAVPAQTFVTSSPRHTWSQGTMEKAWH